MEKKLYTRQVLPEGWIKEYINRDIDGITGKLDEFCPEVKQDIYCKGRVGNTSKGYWSSWWNGESEGNWIDGFIKTAYYSGSETANKKVKKYMEHILDNAGDDGYIGIYDPEHRYQNSDNNGELWCQSRILLALLAYFELYNDKRFFDAAYRCAVLTTTKYGPGANGRQYYISGSYDGGKSHGLCIIEPMLNIYEATDDKRLLDFSVFLYDDFSNTDSSVPMFDDAKYSCLIDPDRPYLSHGVHTCEHLRLLLLLYEATGDEKYLIAGKCAYKKIKKYIGVSGACKSDEWIGAMLPVDDVKVKTRTKDLLFESLPLPEAGYEYCTLTELFISLIKAFEVFGDKAYADMAEKLMLNAGMGARTSDGKSIGYLSADNLYDASKKHGERWDYSATHDDAAVCCVPNAGRLMPAYIANMWMLSAEHELMVLLYGPCIFKTNIAGTDILIREDTGFPFDEHIKFTFLLSHSCGFKLKLRYPEWSAEPDVRINGIRYDSLIKDGFIIINREWGRGDTLELMLPNMIRIVKAADSSVAVSRGPLVYSLKLKENWTITKEYGIEGFYDRDCFPLQGEKWEYILKLQKGETQNTYFELQKNTIKLDYPWDESPVVIEAQVINQMSQTEFVELVPIGCTNLRRTCFPYAVCEGGLRI